MNIIKSEDVFNNVLEFLANPLDNKCSNFIKKFSNGYDKVCIIIPCLYHKDKWTLDGDISKTITSFKKGKYEVIPKDMSVEFKIFDDFFIKEDCDKKDTSSYRSALIKVQQLPDDVNRNRHKEEKDVMFAGYRMYFKPYDEKE